MRPRSLFGPSVLLVRLPGGLAVRPVLLVRLLVARLLVARVLVARVLVVRVLVVRVLVV
jgi:hypothetical protein